MAKQGRAPKHLPTGDHIQLTGTSEVLASFSDVFVLVNEADTGMCSLYFYQRQLGDRGAVLGVTETGVPNPKARCISRILLTNQGIGKLLEALAGNQGYTLTPKTERSK